MTCFSDVVRDPREIQGELKVNLLYRIDLRAIRRCLTLTFPTRSTKRSLAPARQSSVDGHRSRGSHRSHRTGRARPSARRAAAPSRDHRCAARLLLTSKSVEQHRQHRVDLHQGLRRRCESLAEPVLEQAIKKPRGGGDHVHRHVPGGVLAADGGGRLMITDENHHEVTAGVQAE